MISIKDSETIICIYSDYGCRDASCPLNKFHETKEATFAITNIEADGCLKIIDMIFYEDFDSSIRNWIKATHIEFEKHPVPQAIRDIVEGKKPKILIPLARWMRRENVRVGPGVVIPNNRE